VRTTLRRNIGKPNNLKEKVLSRERNALTVIVKNSANVLVSNTYCVVFMFFLVFVLCTLCCQFLWIVFFRLPFGIR